MYTQIYTHTCIHTYRLAISEGRISLPDRVSLSESGLFEKLSVIIPGVVSRHRVDRALPHYSKTKRFFFFFFFFFGGLVSLPTASFRPLFLLFLLSLSLRLGFCLFVSYSVPLCLCLCPSLDSRSICLAAATADAGRRPRLCSERRKTLAL